MLLNFLVDYVRQDALRESFSLDPDQVLEQYGVNQQERELLQARNFQTVRERLDEEVSGLLGEIENFATQEVVLQKLFYGPVNPILKSINPNHGPIGKDISFVLLGAHLNFDASVVFSTPGAPDVKATDLSIPKDGLSIAGRVRLSTPAQYNVVVINTVKLFKGVLPKGFTATK